MSRGGGEASESLSVSQYLRPLLVRAALVTLSAVVCLTMAGAQVRTGLRAGVSLVAGSDVTKSFSYQSREFVLGIEDVPVGVHAGLFLQARLGKLVLQPELLYHSTRTDYRLAEILATETVESVRSEKVSKFEFPLLIAYRWGALRLQAGPVGRFEIARSSELQGVADYLENPTDFSLGYQVGVGLDVWRLLLDIKYDGSVDTGAEAVFIGGQRLDLDSRAGRTYVTLGYALFGNK